MKHMEPKLIVTRLKRPLGEALILKDGQIKIKILKIKTTKVRFGITAPPEIRIRCSEDIVAA